MLPVISDPESLTPVSAQSSTGSADETGRALDLLADRRRRAVLEYLDDNDAPVSLSDLADHVTLEEEGQARGAIAGCGDALLGTRRRVRISLRHHHVPKLEAADVVDFDLEANTVSLRDSGADLLARLEATTEECGGCKHHVQ
ncbi:DUF7344 domain-containing protein [Natronorubrum sp. FCH18a]|uniref:DUF7344 domain-containing protein n=1 Tax=Natronorubrum sp. FCH18a TaxID=3447018 RepID=UPI003F511315